MLTADGRTGKLSAQRARLLTGDSLRGRRTLGRRKGIAKLKSLWSVLLPRLLRRHCCFVQSRGCFC